MLRMGFSLCFDCYFAVHVLSIDAVLTAFYLLTADTSTSLGAVVFPMS